MASSVPTNHRIRRETRPTPLTSAWRSATGWPPTRRIQVHCTPTSGSFLNLDEVWFGIIERQAIHRGTFRSVAELNQAIRAFIDGWNVRAHPFVWTKTADAARAVDPPSPAWHPRY